MNSLKKGLIVAVCLGVSFQLGGCGVGKVIGCIGKDTLKVYNWGEYIDGEVIAEFERENNVCVQYDTFDNNESMVVKLVEGNAKYDVVFPSDYAIEQLATLNLIEEIDWSRIKNISPSLDTSVTNENDMPIELKEILKSLKTPKQGIGFDFLKYSVPYFFGNVGIVYKKDKISIETLENLQWDIFKQKEYITAFYNVSRDAFMPALKQLGFSMNTNVVSEITAAENWLKDQKVKVGNNLRYVGDDVIEDMASSTKYDVALMYSGDANYAISENDSYDYFAPTNGTNSWADGMILMKSSEKKDLSYKFIDFMSTKKSSRANSAFVGYASARNDAYQELIEDEFAGSVNAYRVRYSEFDEIYRHNNETKTLIDSAWIRVKGA